MEGCGDGSFVGEKINLADFFFRALLCRFLSCCQEHRSLLEPDAKREAARRRERGSEANFEKREARRERERESVLSRRGIENFRRRQRHHSTFHSVSKLLREAEAAALRFSLSLPHSTREKSLVSRAIQSKEEPIVRLLRKRRENERQGICSETSVDISPSTARFFFPLFEFILRRSARSTPLFPTSESLRG